MAQTQWSGLTRSVKKKSPFELEKILVDINNHLTDLITIGNQEQEDAQISALG